jgi:hypothetical protein
MGSSEGIALKSIKELPEEIVRKLSEIWITTVEQVVATSATPGGLTSLAQHLGVSEEETRHLVAVARTYLPPEVIAQLEEPVDVSEYGLGALEPPPPENEDQDE